MMFVVNDIIDNLEFCTRKRKKLTDTSDKKEEAHIINHIFVSILFYMIYLTLITVVWVRTYTPLSGKYPCQEGQENCDPDHNWSIIAEGIYEFGHLVLIVFTLGPIRLYFKIKEGKTSMEKIIEDYEDEPHFMDNALRMNKRREQRQMNRGLLPTTTVPTARSNPTE